MHKDKIYSSQSRSEFHFRPIEKDDEALFCAWVGTPEWQEWWEDPKTEWGYVCEAMEDGSAQAYIIEQDDNALGWIQSWRFGANRDFAESINEIYLRDFPDDAVGVDISLDPALLGKGVGRLALRQFCQALQAPIITIDPDKANVRAIKAYENAGFVHHKTYGDTYVMIFEKSSGRSQS